MLVNYAASVFIPFTFSWFPERTLWQSQANRNWHFRGIFSFDFASSHNYYWAIRYVYSEIVQRNKQIQGSGLRYGYFFMIFILIYIYIFVCLFAMFRIIPIVKPFSEAFFTASALHLMNSPQSTWYLLLAVLLVASYFYLRPEQVHNSQFHPQSNISKFDMLD